jgi:hypothetical protein
MANKKRDLIINYLIEAYRKLESCANTEEYDKALIESAFADIQLFGSKEQVILAQNFINEFSKSENVSLNALLAELRKDLRAELDLSYVPKEVIYLRLHKKKNE